MKNNFVKKISINNYNKFQFTSIIYIKYFKDRIESLDDYNPCMQKEENECNILHVHNWIQFFVSMYNDTTTRNNEFEIKLMEVIVS